VAFRLIVGGNKRKPPTLCVTDKLLSHKVLSSTVVIGPDCIGGCQINYHIIVSVMAVRREVLGSLMQIGNKP